MHVLLVQPMSAAVWTSGHDLDHMRMSVQELQIKASVAAVRTRRTAQSFTLRTSPSASYQTSSDSLSKYEGDEIWQE